MTNYFTTAKYRPHNRKDHRHDLPCLHLKIGGREFETYDWSLGGFRIDDFKGRPQVGAQVTVSHMSYDPDSVTDVNSTATVTRILIGKNQVAYAFNELDEKAYELLEIARKRRLSHLSTK
ncbi:MAG: hypothetical protein COB93_06210 [Sneathiella sp.]|nr:MAG: hypothetical protein COB93_06210 [Sneathiella sp.]